MLRFRSFSRIGTIKFFTIIGGRLRPSPTILAMFSHRCRRPSDSLRMCGLSRTVKFHRSNGGWRTFRQRSCGCAVVNGPTNSRAICRRSDRQPAPPWVFAHDHSETLVVGLRELAPPNTQATADLLMDREWPLRLRRSNRMENNSAARHREQNR
jgi:hypothetical protein